MRVPLLRFCLALTLIASLALGTIALAQPPAAEAVAAFPGAEGFGAGAVGGRGGRVFTVSNLNDSGPGSLRECVSASGPRTCVFSVSGRIVLASPLMIANPFITIAGQTAPGNGITLSAGPSITRGIVIVQTNDVVLRYLGLRPGLNANQQLVESEYNIDALTIGDYNRNPYNVVVDHVSMAWATDEILNTARQHSGISIQWSIMSEVNDCDGDPTNNKCGGKGPLFHTGTGTQRGGGDISFHHNLLSSNQGRNPMIKNAGGVTDIVNNVIFPTTRPDGTAITAILDSTHGDINLNFVGNYLIGDPARLNDQRYINYLGMRMAYPYVAGRLGGYSVYVRGNIGPMRPNDVCPGLSQMACELLVINPVHADQTQWDQRGAENLNLNAQGNMVPHVVPQVTTQSALAAYPLVLSQVGKSARLNADGTWTAYRDSIDAKIITDVQNHRSIQISGQPWPASASAWPAGTNVPSYPDADRDGMSDTWENIHFGTLSRGSAANSSADYDSDGYTDLEEFLNGTNPRSTGQLPGATATQPPATRTSVPTNTPAGQSPTATRTPLATATRTSVPPTQTPAGQLPTATQPPQATATYTAAPTEVPPTATPASAGSGSIWADGFEAGNLSGWSSSETDGGDVSVTAAAAVEGAWGLQVVVDDNRDVYVADDRPNAETHYRARFTLDPNSIDMGNRDFHTIFEGYAGDGEAVLRVEMRWASRSYQIRVGLVNNGGRWTNSDWVSVSDAPHALELDWRSASAPGADSGGLGLWIDGAQAASLNGVNNDTRRIDSVRLGGLNIRESSTQGTYFFDNFSSER